MYIDNTSLREEFVSHEIVTEYQPVEVEKFNSQG